MKAEEDLGLISYEERNISEYDKVLKTHPLVVLVCTLTLLWTKVWTKIATPWTPVGTKNNLNH